MNGTRSDGLVLSAEPVSGAKLAAEWLAAHERGAAPVGYGVQNIVRVADELGVSREDAIADFFSMVDSEEMATRPASLQDIVLLALSQGVIFDSSTQAFLLDLCERLDGEPRLDVPANASKLTEELQVLGRILNELMISGGYAGSDAALAAQVWRIETVTTHERQLNAIAHQAAARATIMRRHGLHYFEKEDMQALAKALVQARDIGQEPGTVSKAAWKALARGVVACFWVPSEERGFML
ncbi:MAG TPA: hypothetical protein VLC93_01575, partial [Myxococcota bacterium]|nr:hypothetical protein [Myxococcota bacterium]